MNTNNMQAGASREARRAAPLWLALMMALVAACGDDERSPAGPVAREIDVAGGVVRVEAGPLAGATVTVPPGALATKANIAISEGAPAGALLAGLRATGAVVRLGPEGQTFAKPVSLAIPAGADSALLLTRPLGGAWAQVTGARHDRSLGAMTADVSHFSEFVPVAPTGGSDAALPPGPGSGDRDAGAGPVGPDAARTDAATPDGARPDAAPPPQDGPGADAPAVDAPPPVDAAPLADAAGPVPVACSAGTVRCGSVCAAIASDVLHCGACNARCAEGQRCVSGACSAAAACNTLPAPARTAMTLQPLAGAAAGGLLLSATYELLYVHGSAPGAGVPQRAALRLTSGTPWRYDLLTVADGGETTESGTVSVAGTTLTFVPSCPAGRPARMNAFSSQGRNLTLVEVAPGLSLTYLAP